MKLHFTKMHALGNDFIVIDGRKQEFRVRFRDLSKKLCHRRFGIGADQMLLLKKSRMADFKMRIFNPDGSEAEMCGNGIRCLAKYIWDKQLKTQKLSIETLAGIIHLEKRGELIRVDMGEPILEPEKIPVRIGKKSELIINYPLQIDDKEFKITCVSMGNPHTIILLRDVGSFPVSHYGPMIERYEFFPKKTNVEFIEILNRRNIKMRLWERGAGETMACGTGACAVAVAGVLMGLSDRLVTVHLLGGKLLIEWAEDNHIYMTGPAVTVFEGTINLK